jgi:hypothetical protein
MGPTAGDRPAAQRSPTPAESREPDPMTPETYSSLLKDLQRLEKRISEAFVARARTQPELMVRLTQRHADSEVGGRVDDFVSLCARKSAVQFLLRTVYVRVLEDLGALDPPRIRGERGLAVFRDVAPGLGVRSYLRFVFGDLSRDFPGLFVAGADEMGELPDEDLCREVWALWHHPNRDGVPYQWNGDRFDSRFLGDLYQDLDAEVRKRYALLQTPDFVERYILDHTLTPALAELGLDGLRVLDPTCGSGHFLIGAFHRLADAWGAQGLDRRAAAERALDGVWGCDINPHAVDIARFRLLLELMAYSGETSLEALGDVSERLHLQVLDSLVPWERGGAKGEQLEMVKTKEPTPEQRLQSYATPAERAANAAFLRGGFHVVVGNPPYITPKDVRKRDDYRAFWPDSAAGAYAMSAPFAERFFDLGVSGAFVGQITANSFMKREFGKKLVERALPRVELTQVVDTSGAYIPGHGTPTVILFGRNRTPPRHGSLWAVLGKRGEPKRPAVAAEGLVWSAIARSGEVADDTSPFVTVAAVEREVFRKHPWSLGGGAAAEITESVIGAASTILGSIRGDGGRTVHTGEDGAFFGDSAWLRRCAEESTVALVQGEDIRDFAIATGSDGFLPYHCETLRPRMPSGPGTRAHLWRLRRVLRERRDFGQFIEERGLEWFEWSMFFPNRFRTPLSIAFAFVSTHNHFVLDRGGKVFNRTAPVIKLPATASEDDHLDLLGLLNSSTLGFWMKQAFYDRGNGGIGGGIAAEDWERFYEFDSTKLQSAPLTTADRASRVALAAALDAAARERAACLPAAVLRAGEFTPDTLPAVLAAARDRYRALTHRLVALQEELDWLTYASYGLLDASGSPVVTVGPDDVEPLAPGHRPFEVRFARLDDDAEPDEKSAWWSRHGHDRVTEVPAHYSAAHRACLEERLARIDEDPRLQLLETAAFKRRWQTPDLDAEARDAAERWLLDSLEDLFAPTDSASPVNHIARGRLAAPNVYRLETIVNEWQKDPRVAAVCGIYSGGGTSVDIALVAERLLRGHGLPDNPRRLYTAEGLRKRDAWKQTWHLQDLEDQQQPLPPEYGGRIPLPPKYDKGDFQADAFAVRGKLDVPRERFIRFDDLRIRAYGWNGWRDRERAIAQAEAYALAEGDVERPLPEPSVNDPRRCGPTMGLWESLGDLKRWGDKETHAELAGLAREACRQTTCPCPVVEAWQAWREKKLTIAAEQAVTEAPVTVSERARLLAVWPKDMLGPVPEVSLGDLAAAWAAASHDEARFERVFDAAVIEGDVTVKGRGKARRAQRGDAQ